MREKNVQRLTADPRLNAEPAAGDYRAHQCRQIRPVGSVCRPGKHGEGNAVFGAGMRIEQDWHEYDSIAEQNRDQCLPPVHARGDQPRRKHIGRDAVGHPDPERRVVVGGPVSLGTGTGRQIFVVKRTGLICLATSGRSSTRPSGCSITSDRCSLWVVDILAAGLNYLGASETDGYPGCDGNQAGCNSAFRVDDVRRPTSQLNLRDVSGCIVVRDPR